MKKFLLALIALFAITQTVCSQTMKVYQNGQLKAIYYVSKDDKVEFSDDFPFPDDDKNIPNTNGHEYVDLGLPSGILWATMNVGASSPEEYGDYFAWGETQPKSVYSSDTYFDSNNNKYSTSKKTTLDLEDDAAHVNWGGGWRMPTKAEQDELRNTNNCTWTWTIQNGVYGYKVTSKKNGNSIFLPAAGYRYDSSLYLAGSGGSYWSSSLSTDDSNGAYFLYFNSSYVDWGYNYRDIGPSVRAVCQ